MLCLCTAHTLLSVPPSFLHSWASTDAVDTSCQPHLLLHVLMVLLLMPPPVLLHLLMMLLLPLPLPPPVHLGFANLTHTENNPELAGWGDVLFNSAISTLFRAAQLDAVATVAEAWTDTAIALALYLSPLVRCPSTHTHTHIHGSACKKCRFFILLVCMCVFNIAWAGV